MSTINAYRHYRYFNYYYHMVHSRSLPSDLSKTLIIVIATLSISCYWHIQNSPIAAILDRLF